MSIILFDGECNFCNGSVQFIIKRDSKYRFKFASIQSEIGQSLLKDHNLPKTMDSMILIENNRCFLKSTAALRISRKMDHMWKALYVLILVPKPFRDVIYDIIAKNRHKISKKNQCMLPKKEDLERFLN